MKTIKALGKEHIRVLIKDAMKKYGNECDLNHIDVSEMTSLSGVFSPQYENNCSAFNGDISKWDTSKVTDMSYLFYNSKFQGDISQWNTANVKDMSGMFAKSLFNGDLSRWNVSKVKYFNSMFQNTPFQGDISRWDTSKVQDMSMLFYKSRFRGDLSRWDTSQVKCMTMMFMLSPFQGDISKWNVGQVNDMSHMFANCPFQGDLSDWDLRSLQDYGGVFSEDHHSPLGYLHMLQQDYCFLDKDPRAKPFLQARQLCAQLGLNPLESAQYIYHAMGQTKQMVIPGLSDFSGATGP